MKITRRQLRQLIIEAARTYIVDPEGVATPSDVAYELGRKKDDQIAGLDPKLSSLMKGSSGVDTYGPNNASYRKMGRELAVRHPDLDYDNPLTPAEETAVDSLGIRSKAQDSLVPEFNDIDPEQFVKLSKNKTYCNFLRNTYGDVFSIVGEMPEMTLENNDYDGMGDEFRVYSEFLGCEIEDMGVIDSLTEVWDDDFNPLFTALHDYFFSNKNVSFPTSDHYPKELDNKFVSINVDGRLFIYDYYEGFATFYFCAR